MALELCFAGKVVILGFNNKGKPRCNVAPAGLPKSRLTGVGEKRRGTHERMRCQSGGLWMGTATPTRKTGSGFSLAGAARPLYTT